MSEKTRMGRLDRKACGCHRCDCMCQPDKKQAELDALAEREMQDEAKETSDE